MFPALKPLGENSPLDELFNLSDTSKTRNILGDEKPSKGTVYAINTSSLRATFSVGEIILGLLFYSFGFLIPILR
jgi:hypothetical protein